MDRLIAISGVPRGRAEPVTELVHERQDVQQCFGQRRGETLEIQALERGTGEHRRDHQGHREQEGPAR